MSRRGRITSIDELPISDSTRRRNPGLFADGRVGGLGADQHSQPARALERKAPAKRRSRVRVARGAEIVVTLTAHILRRMDADNLGTAFKALQDAIAEELGVDDGDERVRWEYGQVETRGTQGVSVKIERIRT